MNKEQADLEKALASSADEHAKLLAAKQTQEKLLVEHLSHLNISPESKGKLKELHSDLLTSKCDLIEEIKIETESLHMTEDLIRFDESEVPIETIESEPKTQIQSEKDPLNTELSLAMATETVKYPDYSHKGSQGLVVLSKCFICCPIGSCFLVFSWNVILF